MMATTSGKGYWLVTRGGRVVPFGDANRHGHAKHLSSPIVGADNHFDNGYWLVTRFGHVRAFGQAQNFGDASDKHLNSPVVGFTSTADGNGYWLVTSMGRILAFGSAQNHGYPGRTAMAPISRDSVCTAPCGGSVPQDLPD